MGSLANLPTFAAGPTTYTHSDFNAVFAALTIAPGAVGTNELASQAVTLAKMQHIAQYQLLARSTAGGGAPELLTANAFVFSLLALADAAAGRTAFELGSMATQAASDVAITGGSAALAKYEAIQSVTTSVLNFSGDTSQTIALSGNTNFTSSNLAANRHKLVKVVCDGTNRVLAFPAGWTFVGGPSPTAIIANKTALLACAAYGAADSDVVASFVVQP